ncbi:hypothetical protein BCR34DRAFT_450678, partial [Clohesyomyces aquaticus]
LLPTPLASNTVTLGQLLSDPLDPSSESFISTSIRQVLREPSIQSRYKDLVSHDDEGRLVSSLSGRPLSPSQENLLVIQADEMKYCSLKHPSASFDALSNDPAAQSWFRQMQNRPLYYVVGVQQLKNPTFKRAVIREGSVAEASSDSKIRIPMHVRRDSAMDFDAPTNDGVYGLEVRKVKCRVGSRTEPHSLDDIGLSWSYHMLDAEQDLQLSIGLGYALSAAELRGLAGIVSDD